MDKQEKEFLSKLMKNGFDISDLAIVTFGKSSTVKSIKIGILETDNKSTYFGRMAFASDVDLTLDSNDDLKINFGSSGSFTPETKNSYWRTIHAASILKNWEKFKELFKEYV